MNALTQRYAKRSNTRLFSSKGDRHETHLPTLGSPPQADPRVSRAHEDRRRTQGSARAARQGPRPALGLTLRRLAIGAALTFLLVSPVFYAVGVVRHDETFSIAVPVALFVAIAWSLWPYRRTASVRERSAQQVQPA